MTRYLIEETVTSQASAAVIKNPHDRTEAVRPILESVGGKLGSFNSKRAFITKALFALHSWSARS